MSQAPTPNQPYFSGINYNPAFFTAPSGVSLTYSTNNFIQRVGTNPTSVATNTTFSGSINARSITTTTDSTIGGNLTVNNNLTISNDSTIGGNLTVSRALSTTYITSNSVLTANSPLINLNGSVVVNNNTGVYKFFNMNCPINQVFSTR
jgi:predicted acyltransferase (DUF342 family)